MDKSSRQLYERIKDYDLESLRVNLLCHLETTVDAGDIHPRVRSFMMGARSTIRYIQRELGARASLETSLNNSPEKTEEIIEYIQKAIKEYKFLI